MPITTFVNSIRNPIVYLSDEPKTISDGLLVSFCDIFGDKARHKSDNAALIMSYVFIFMGHYWNWEGLRLLVPPLAHKESSIIELLSNILLQNLIRIPRPFLT